MATFKSLGEAVESWEEWARGAPRGEDGWQSNFPQWLDLIRLACECMLTGNVSESQLALVDRCWAISEEDEDMLDFAKDNLELCFAVVCRLVSSENRDVRWQALRAVAAVGSVAEKILKRALDDADNYVKRIALQGLSTLRKPKDWREIVARVADDPDPYVRSAALDLANS